MSMEEEEKDEDIWIARGGREGWVEEEDKEKKTRGRLIEYVDYVYRRLTIGDYVLKDGDTMFTIGFDLNILSIKGWLDDVEYRRLTIWIYV